MTGTSLASKILAFGIVAFIGVASAVLLWDGLAAEVGKGAGPSWRTRARLVVGGVGFAIALWVALGILTRAR